MIGRVLEKVLVTTPKGNGEKLPRTQRRKVKEPSYRRILLKRPPT
jgi:hypothetical protein